jgi:fructokinase
MMASAPFFIKGRGMTDERRFAGVELGGTKCVVVLATQEGDILDQVTMPTLEPGVTLAGITASLDRWWREGAFEALGIASFGPLQLDPQAPDYGSITSTAKPGWRDTPVRTLLAQRYAVPIAFDTDVNGAASAEGRWGGARGLQDYAYVTVGTGIGVGLIVNGRPTRGLGHCEAGHMHVLRLPGDDWVGQCPYHGACVEGLASGPAIAARVGAAGEEVPADHRVWTGVVEALAQMAQSLVCAAGPRRLMFGGGVMSSRPELLDRIDARLRELIGEYLPLPAKDFVTAPALGTRAGPLGPIALALAADPLWLDAKQRPERAHAA